ncbi:MAG: T9SS type A sorting domain-containing protein [Bacteroidota bacterium]
MAHVKLKLSVVLLLVLGLTSLHAQDVIPAAGGNASGSGGTVSFSAGQVFYSFNENTEGSEAQGVQQPWEISVITGIEDSQMFSLKAKTYPNPTANSLTLDITGDVNAENDLSLLSYQLYDMSGQLLQNRKITDRQTKIVMSDLASATYFLSLIQENRETQHFKQDKMNNKQFKVVKTFKILKR